MKGIFKRNVEFPKEQFPARVIDILSYGYQITDCCSDMDRYEEYPPPRRGMAYITYVGAE